VRLRSSGSRLALASALAVAAYAGVLVVVNNPSPAATAPAAAGARALPPIAILPSRGVQSQLNLATARAITRGLLAGLHRRGERG
jgi:hypothetical protein